jgi:hypothetical protein
MATWIEFAGQRIKPLTIKIPDSERRYPILLNTFDPGAPKVFQMEDADATWLLAYEAENGVGNWRKYESEATKSGKPGKPGKTTETPTEASS